MALRDGDDPSKATIKPPSCEVDCTVPVNMASHAPPLPFGCVGLFLVGPPKHQGSAKASEHEVDGEERKAVLIARWRRLRNAAWLVAVRSIDDGGQFGHTA